MFPTTLAPRGARKACSAYWTVAATRPGAPCAGPEEGGQCRTRRTKITTAVKRLSVTFLSFLIQATFLFFISFSHLNFLRVEYLELSYYTYIRSLTSMGSIPLNAVLFFQIHFPESRFSFHRPLSSCSTVLQSFSTSVDRVSRARALSSM